MHKLLERQLKRIYGENAEKTFTLKEQELIEAVSHTYEEFNQERSFIEHTMELNARELEEVNRKIRLQNEDVLHQLEQYKYAIDAVLIVSITDTRGIISYANDNFCNISGYSREELIGSSHNIVRHPENDSSVFKELWQTIQQKKIWQKILKNLKKNGETYYVFTTIFPLVDKEGTIIEYMGIREDVTEQIVFQRQLEESERRTLAILNNLESIVVIFRQGEGVVEANQKFYDVFGFEGFEAFRNKYQCVCELFIEKEGYLKTSTETVDWFEPLLENPDEIHRAMIRDKTGDVRTFNVQLGSLRIEKETSYIATFSDITELEKAREKAEKAEKVKAEFLANMSHEIRTPMNGILGFIQLLAKTTLDEKQQKYVSLVNNSTNTLLSIINDILDFSKIESGMLVKDTISINPFKEFENTFLLLSEKAKEKRISYTMHMDPNIGSCLMIDSVRIRQVLLNLIGNAIKFTPIGGEVRLVIQLVARNDEYDKVSFSVSDTGIGIPPERQEKIFAPFSQADSSITRKFGGTGLGLSISRSLVEMMGGRFELHSVMDQGSCFFFTIDMQRCADDKVADSAQEPSAPEQKKVLDLRVLIAEDYEINRILIAEILTNYGVTFVFAVNGEEAVSMADQGGYDLILMDINMPIMNGIEATQAIRLFDTKTPIIALTANALEGDKQRYLEAGMEGHLTKPIEVHELEEVLYSCVKNTNSPFCEDELSDDDIRLALTQTVETMHLSPAIVEKFLSSFLKSIDGLFAKFQEGIDTNDFQKIEYAMHDIKTGLATLGLSALAEKAKTMEYHARKREPYPYAQVHEYICAQVKKLKAYHKQQS